MLFFCKTLKLLVLFWAEGGVVWWLMLICKDMIVCAHML